MKRAQQAIRGIVRMLAALLIPISASADPFLWIDDDQNRLYTVDLATGASRLIGEISANEEITDIAMSPDGFLWGISFSSIWRIDRTMAVASRVGRHGISGGNALTFDSDGRLFAAGASSSRLFLINQETGEGTALPGTMGAGAAGDIVFADDALYLSDSGGRLVRLLLAAPFPYEVTPITVGNLSAANVYGLALASDMSGRLFATAGSTVYLVNKTTAELTQFSTLPAGVRVNGATSEYAASVTVVEPPDVELAPYRALATDDSATNTVSMNCNYGVNFSVGTPSRWTLRPSLVLIVHGWATELPEFLADPIAWANELQQAVVADIRATPGTGTWDVCALDWRAVASTVTPSAAYAAGNAVAEAIWPRVRLGDYAHVHLIGHSAGSHVVERLSALLKNSIYSEPPVVHATFLDPYDAGNNDEQFNSDYGCTADWAENYVDMRSEIYGPLKNANLTLDCALNVDVTSVDPTPDDSLSGIDEVRYHAWPHQLYRYTAGVQSQFTQGLDPLDVWMFGFGLAKESGRFPFTANPNSWSPVPQARPEEPTGLPSHATPGLERRARICLGRARESDGITRTRTISCVDRAPVFSTVNPPAPVLQTWPVFVPESQPAWLAPTAVTTPSITGIVSTTLPAPGVARLTTGSPAWVVISARIPQAIDSLRFNYDFDGAVGGNGLLSVYVDNEPVFRMTQAVAGRDQRSSGVVRFGRLRPGYHSLAFRLDALTNVASEVTVSALETGVVTIEREAAVAPIAGIQGPGQARLGSTVRLEGAGSVQNALGPRGVTYFWSRVGGPIVELSDASAKQIEFMPTTPGQYRLALTVRDLWQPSRPAFVTVEVPKLGDVDLDGDVDKSDVKQIDTLINTAANGPNDLRDLNGDLRIDKADIDLAKANCTAGSCGGESGGGTVDWWLLLGLGALGAGAARHLRPQTRKV